MVTYAENKIVPIGIGRNDYSLNISSNVEPVIKGRLGRITATGSASLPGIYTNNFLQITLVWPVIGTIAAPETPIHIFDAWATIVSANTSAQIWLWMAEYVSPQALATGSGSTSLGQNQGILSTDLTWTKGFTTKKGYGYALDVYITDAGLNAFKLFYGICGIIDSRNVEGIV